VHWLWHKLEARTGEDAAEGAQTLQQLAAAVLQDVDRGLDRRRYPIIRIGPPGDSGIFKVGPMPIRITLAFVLALGMAVPAYADRRSDAKAQVDFGIAVAQKGLWKEATYRWEKAVEVDPTYAAAWNDLGIGYEQQGKFDDARKAYEKAIELEPKNNYIRQNYDLFREIYDRQNRRRDR
jgi:tetratricopeptide (TPR) repeat protein